MIEAAVLLAAGLRCDLAGDTASVTLDRPARRNAQTPAMWNALAQIGRALPGDVRFVVVRGAGDSFSSGLDRSAFGAGDDGVVTLGSIAQLPEPEALAVIELFQGAFSWLTRPDLVTIAAVQGHAIGAGFQLALACDVRIAADDAQFSLPEGTLGLVPDLGGTRPLVRAVGYSRALEIALTGRRVGAGEAAALGFANVVVPRAELDSAVADCLEALRATPRSTATEMKALLSAALGQTAQQQLASEREGQLRRLKERFETGD